MCDINKLDWTIKEEFEPIDDIPEDELDEAPNPASSGFWYDICDDGYKFIELLENPETKKACEDALNVLSSLESAVDEYVCWM